MIGMNNKTKSWLLVISFGLVIPLVLNFTPFPIFTADLDGVNNTEVPISAQFKNSTVAAIGTPEDVIISGKYAFVAENTAGIRLLDISTIELLQLQASQYP